MKFGGMASFGGTSEQSTKVFSAKKNLIISQFVKVESERVICSHFAYMSVHLLIFPTCFILPTHFTYIWV